MTIGALRHWIALDDPEPPVPDGDGGYTQEWTPLRPWRVKAAIEDAAAVGEHQKANTVEATSTKLITLRFHPHVSTRTRVTFGTRQFAVTRVETVQERGAWSRLTCEEKVA